MDFTREPIVETIITPKDGCKLAIRSSKAASQEEYFVSALEIVSFGNALFYRSLERPKSFLVPVSDYEILEVRETRMVLKTVGLGKGKGSPKESRREAKESKAKDSQEAKSSDDKTEGKSEKRRTRRKSDRRRRVQEEREAGRSAAEKPAEEGDKGEAKESGKKGKAAKEEKTGAADVSAENPEDMQPATLPVAPPPQLISETMARYRDNEQYRGAFFTREEDDEMAQEEAPGESSEAGLEEGAADENAGQPEEPSDTEPTEKQAVAGMSSEGPTEEEQAQERVEEPVAEETLTASEAGSDNAPGRD